MNEYKYNPSLVNLIMDKPQYQVMGNSGDAFRYMAYPFQRQQLQLLYPGRPMEQYYHYSGDNIPNPNPMGLRITKEVDNTLEDVSRMENEALARRYGGIHNIINYPAVEPEAIIEDPRLTSLEIKDTIGLNPNSEFVNSPYDSLPGTYKTAQSEVDYVRGREEGRDRRRRFVDNKLPRYNWREIPEEEYPPQPSWNKPFYNSTQKKTLNKESQPKYKKSYSEIRNIREPYTRTSMKRSTPTQRTPIKRRRRTVGVPENSKYKEVVQCYTDGDGKKTCTKMTCGVGTCKKQACDEYGENCTGIIEDCGGSDGNASSDQCLHNDEFKWYMNNDNEDGSYTKVQCSPSTEKCVEVQCNGQGYGCHNVECDYTDRCLNGIQNMKTRIDCNENTCTVYNYGDGKCNKREGCDSNFQNEFGGVYVADNCSLDVTSCEDKNNSNRTTASQQEYRGNVVCNQDVCGELYCGDNKVCKRRICKDENSCSDTPFQDCNYDELCDHQPLPPWYKKIPTWGWIVIGFMVLIFIVLIIWLIYHLMTRGKTVSSPRQLQLQQPHPQQLHSQQPHPQQLTPQQSYAMNQALQKIQNQNLQPNVPTSGPCPHTPNGTSPVINNYYLTSHD